MSCTENKNQYGMTYVSTYNVKVKDGESIKYYI